MSRWLLTDPVAVTTYTFEVNPNQMSSVFADRQTMSGPSVVAGSIRLIRQVEQPKEFSFSGNYRSQAQYDQLLLWCQKGYAVELSDHFDRDWSVILLAFDVDEKKPSQRVEWKGTYRVRGLLLGAA